MILTSWLDTPSRWIWRDIILVLEHKSTLINTKRRTDRPNDDSIRDMTFAEELILTLPYPIHSGPNPFPPLTSRASLSRDRRRTRYVHSEFPSVCRYGLSIFVSDLLACSPRVEDSLSFGIYFLRVVSCETWQIRGIVSDNPIVHVIPSLSSCPLHLMGYDLHVPY